ncbi:hypothetical protein [Paraburkholderia sp. RL17-347-BIC-D]|uniref:hypothetical protein n=1 Tax=Paraburkholderia sp. RL17-347-BIC-D TaxID=3031632 RepID=UPI0038B7C4C6
MPTIVGRVYIAFDRAIRLGLAGRLFENEPQHNTLRLSFDKVPPAKIDEGVARLAALVRASM